MTEESVYQMAAMHARRLGELLDEIFPNTDYDFGMTGRGDSTFFTIWVPFATGHRQVPIEWRRIQSQGDVNFLTYNLRLMLAGEEYDEHHGGADALPEALEIHEKGAEW